MQAPRETRIDSVLIMSQACNLQNFKWLLVCAGLYEMSADQCPCLARQMCAFDPRSSPRSSVQRAVFQKTTETETEMGILM